MNYTVITRRQPTGAAAGSMSYNVNGQLFSAEHERRAGTQGKSDAHRASPYCASRLVALGPGSHSARARALAALARDTPALC